MRYINIAAALSGAIALVMLVLVAHVLELAAADADRVQLGAFIQLATAAAGLAIASRAGLANIVGGAMTLGGAALFSGTLYALSLTHVRELAMLAPFGGMTLIAGWIVLAFAKPARLEISGAKANIAA